MKYLISFALPCYNVEKYVIDCLRSIYAQGLNEDEFEILCIDDCSTDKTYECIATFMASTKSQDQIRLLKNEENKGLAGTRNELIKNARGKYIRFVDPDDLLAKNATKYLVSVAEKYNTDATLANIKTIKENTAYDYIDEFVQKYDINDVTEVNRNIFNIITYNIDTHRNVSLVTTGIYRRDFLINENCFFDSKI